jgi:hypothetical protein
MTTVSLEGIKNKKSLYFCTYESIKSTNTVPGTVQVYIVLISLISEILRLLENTTHAHYNTVQVIC